MKKEAAASEAARIAEAKDPPDKTAIVEETVQKPVTTSISVSPTIETGQVLSNTEKIDTELSIVEETVQKPVTTSISISSTIETGQVLSNTKKIDTDLSIVEETVQNSGKTASVFKSPSIENAQDLSNIVESSDNVEVKNTEQATIVMKLDEQASENSESPEETVQDEVVLQPDG